MAANGISTLPTKEERQIAKLDLAADKRNQSYDRDLLPSKYVGNVSVPNAHPDGLQPNRPWTDVPPGPTNRTFAWTSDNNQWSYGISSIGASTFSNPAPTNPAYTYPGDSSTGKTYNFDGTTWMASRNLGISGSWADNSITVDYWFYPTANGVQLLSESNNPDVTSGYHYSMLEIDGSGYVTARLYNGTYPASTIVSSQPVDLNQWNHIYLTEDTQGGHSFELNGVGTGIQNPVYIRISPGASTEYFVVGTTDSTNLGSSGRFQGKLGLLQISDSVVASTYSTSVAKYRIQPTYTLTSDGSVDEGGGLTFTASGTNVPDATYYWTIETNSGDFTTTSGSLGVSNNYGSFIVAPNADATTEGAETFTVALRSGSVSGPILVTSDPITINDTSQTSTSLTFNNVTLATQSPFATGASYSFDGASTSTIVAPGSDSWAVGTGDFTIEWFQYQTDSNSFTRIFHRGAAYPAQEIGVSIEGGTFYGWVKGATSFGSPTPYKNAWVHFAMVRSGTSLKIYKNGTQLGSTSTNLTNFADTSSVLTIGRETSGVAGTQFGGYITNFRWVKGLAVYTGNFTVPTSTLTSTADANPYGGSNTVAIPSGYTKLLVAPTSYTVRQWLGTYSGGGTNSTLMVLLADYPDAGTIPVGAITTLGTVSSSVAAEGYGQPCWFIQIPGVTAFAAGDSFTFSWTA